jgi:hypothetical protein
MNPPPIPRALRDRPVWHGYVVPANVMWDNDGVPDFATINEELSRLLMEARQCALCGKRMRREFAFLGGPQSIGHRHFRDGPMHEDCARYAMAVCPFVSGQRRAYRSLEVKREFEGHEHALIPTAPPPPLMGLLIAGDYEVLPGGIVRAGPALREIEWIAEEETANG